MGDRGAIGVKRGRSVDRYGRRGRGGDRRSEVHVRGVIDRVGRIVAERDLGAVRDAVRVGVAPIGSRTGEELVERRQTVGVEVGRRVVRADGEAMRDLPRVGEAVSVGVDVRRGEARGRVGAAVGTDVGDRSVRIVLGGGAGVDQDAVELNVEVTVADDRRIAQLIGPGHEHGRVRGSAVIPEIAVVGGDHLRGAVAPQAAHLVADERGVADLSLRVEHGQRAIRPLVGFEGQEPRVEDAAGRVQAGARPAAAVVADDQVANAGGRVDQVHAAADIGAAAVERDGPARPVDGRPARPQAAPLQTRRVVDDVDVHERARAVVQGDSTAVVGDACLESRPRRVEHPSRITGTLCGHTRVQKILLDSRML